MKRVLIIEDDPEFCEAVARTISTQYEPLRAFSGMEGLKVARSERPDLILIDLNMPKMDGFEVCQELRLKPATRDIPIIILTGEDGPDSRVKGLDAGADDYVAKPFHSQELLARIRAKLRRHQSERKRTDLLCAGNLRVDPASSRAWIGDELLRLTERELELLLYFMENPNQMISRERLLGDLWADAVVTSRTVDAHMANLRRKLRGFSCALKTVFRRGYILEVPEY